MRNRNMKQWASELLQRKEVAALPIMTHPGIEMIGKTVRDAVTDGEVHYQAIKALYDHYPSEATCVIMDLTVEAEAFGSEIVFPENEVPSVSGRLLPDEGAIDTLQVPDLTRGRIPEYLKANRLAAENINDKPVFGGCIGPYSLAGRLYDMTEIMMLIYINPEAAHTLLRKCTEFLINYCKALKATGVDGVVMAEPAAGLLSNEDCLTYSSTYVKEIVDQVQDDHFFVILHNCGNTGHCTQATVATGAAGYHFGNKINMVDALKEVPADALALGNLDPVSCFKMGSPESVRQAALELLEAASSYPNFILSSGCDVPPHTSLANIDAFYQAVKDFNESKK
jgi:uroporphyrinogen decarboxylase